MKHIKLFEGYDGEGEYEYDFDYIEECFVEIEHRPFSYKDHCRLFFPKNKRHVKDKLESYLEYISQTQEIINNILASMDKVMLKYPKAVYKFNDDRRNFSLDLFPLGKIIYPDQEEDFFQN